MVLTWFNISGFCIILLLNKSYELLLTTSLKISTAICLIGSIVNVYYHFNYTLLANSVWVRNFIKSYILKCSS